MQYATVVEQDPVTVKQRLAAELRLVSRHESFGPHGLHALLALLPVSVYLTTNYDDNITRTLRHVGRSPVTAICPWHMGSTTSPNTRLPSSYDPTPESPLVYHLHGSFESPASLVLTESDHLEFLVGLGGDREHGGSISAILPVQILRALAQQPLLILGYSLRDWSFRILHQALVAAVPDVFQRRHVGVELARLSGDAESQSRAWEYLARTFEYMNISMYWGSTAEFCAELGRRLDYRPTGSDQEAATPSSR